MDNSPENKPENNAQNQVGYGRPPKSTRFKRKRDSYPTFR
jgi:hypothetical protein